MYDVCIIGGGVAGLSAAITVADGKKSAVIIEKNQKLGKKIYATGGGRCNLSNTDMSIKDKYHSSDRKYADFIGRVMGDNPCGAVRRFMLDIGVPTYDKNGYIYPASMQASAVAWAMIDRVKAAGVNIRLKEECLNIQKKYDVFQITTSGGKLSAKKVIITCGGMSAPSLGGSDKGYALVKGLGDRLNPIRPALCGVTTDADLSFLAGVRALARATIFDGNNNAIRRESGELQITADSLSGIIIFNLSSVIGGLLQHNESCAISLDFLNDITADDITGLCGKNKYRTVTGLFNGFINDRIASYAVDSLGIEKNAIIGRISADTRDALISLLSDMRFNVTGLKGYEQAQVCAGGVSLSCIAPSSLESLNTRGLYYAGEIIDVDGVCGGYNITFSILSGIRAGEACI